MIVLAGGLSNHTVHEVCMLLMCNNGKKKARKKKGRRACRAISP